jgi:hypothetical protein
MFVMLSRVLLWLLLGSIVFALFQKFNPKDGNFVGRLFLAILLIVLILSFFNPGGSGTVVSPIWQLISFPLKPLGAAILLMIVAAQKMKAGGIDKPGGFMVGWALTILLIASTPAFAYFLVNPRLTAMLPEGQPKQTLVALTNPADTQGISLGSIRSDVPTLFMQSTPSDVSRRGRVALEDFVPNAQTLSQTTTAWEAYLSQVFIFLRGR